MKICFNVLGGDYSKIVLYKNIMRKIFITLYISFIALTGYTQIADLNDLSNNFIEVKGFANNHITPDRIYLKILVNEKDIKGKVLNEIEKSMFGKLQEIGIDIQKDLVVKDFISNFKHYWILKSDIHLIKEYQVLVQDAEMAGKVFMELERLGISNISIDKLEHSEIERYKDELRIEAIKSARKKAKELTNAIGQDIGGALYIFENTNIDIVSALQGNVSGIMVRGYSMQGIYGSRAPEPDVEFEKIKLEYNVTVRFELK